MDLDMYRHPATQRNLERLREYDYTVLPAAHGELASGLVGQGRMPEPEVIVDRVDDLLEGRPYAAETPVDDARPAPSDSEETGDSTERPDAPTSDGTSAPVESDEAEVPADLQGRHVLVTAGPTQEPVDPVRMLTNPSTGRMGYAIARAARRRGARVTLVSGPTHLDPPDGVDVVSVQTADEMNDAVQSRRDDADIIIGAAAVADYAPRDPSSSKRKKGEEDIVLRLRRTPDVLKTAGANKHTGQILVGFALETDDGGANARKKLRAKNLDWIVLNNPNEEGAGFGTATNRVTLLSRDGTVEELPLLSKEDVADALLDRVVDTEPAPVPSPS
jgi:phosphopantothenoylcysteine decarboxylase/phosphopantothenate--cysteine ligase